MYDDDSSAANRALVHRLTRPRAPRRSAHPCYAVLLRMPHGARDAAVATLANAIRAVPGVSYAQAWLTPSGGVMRVYVAFGPEPVTRTRTRCYLDVLFGDVRDGDGKPVIGDKGGPVDAIIAAWWAWARKL